MEAAQQLADSMIAESESMRIKDEADATMAVRSAAKQKYDMMKENPLLFSAEEMAAAALEFKAALIGAPKQVAAPAVVAAVEPPLAGSKRKAGDAT